MLPKLPIVPTGDNGPLGVKKVSHVTNSVQVLWGKVKRTLRKGMQ
jgi:hypothetical protein